MKITYLSPSGVLDVEQEALKEIERRLPRDWVGFAGFQLVPPTGNPLDIDLLVLTHNRILVVELKNWKGEITYSNQQWIQQGRASRSPVEVTTNKARKLLPALKNGIPKTPIPFIEALVVLCHPEAKPQFPESEWQHVLMLPDFCGLADAAKYNARYPATPAKFDRPSANPLNALLKFQRYFSPGQDHIRQIKFSYQGYLQDSDHPDFVHPRHIFEEFFATHKESKSSRALIRKWNLNSLAGGNTTATERSNIVLRETRLNEYVRHHSDELHRSLLEPIGQPTSEDVTTNFSELYRLPPKLERLDSYLNRQERNLSFEEKLQLTKALLNRYAQLHAFGVAHRDIAPHSIWVDEPCRIVMSSFSTAYFPEQMTVGPLRHELETGAIKVPEDKDGSSLAQPFRRDVFLLGVIAYRILSGTRLTQVDDVPSIADTVVTEELKPYLSWFNTVLAVMPGDRFANAQDALDRLNDLDSNTQEYAVDESDFASFRTNANPASLPPKEQISLQDGKWVYRADTDAGPVIVKIWTGLVFDAKRSTRNVSLLRFLEKARSMRLVPSTDYPQIVDYGLGPLGTVLITRWVDGQTLEGWAKDNQSNERRATVALELLRLTLRLHANGLDHGDIKPQNLIVDYPTEGKPRLTLIDIPDMQGDGSEGHTPAYVSSAVSGMPTQLRDRYAANATCKWLLRDVEPAFIPAIDEIDRAAQEAENGVPIEIVADTLQKLLTKEPPAGQRHAFNVYSTSLTMEQGRQAISTDNGKLYVGVEPSRRDSNVVVFFVSGLTEQLSLFYNVATERVEHMQFRPLTQQDFRRAVNKSDFNVLCDITVFDQCDPAHFGPSDNEDDGDFSYEATALVQFLASLAEANGVLVVHATDEKSTQVQPDTTSSPESQAQHGRYIDTRSLWAAMSRSEQENAPSVTILDGAVPDPTNSNRMLVPYDLATGTLDFAKGEEVSIMARWYDPVAGEERWRPVARLNLEFTNGSVLAVEEMKYSFSVERGSEYRLRSRLEEIAMHRRQLATKRILDGTSLIGNLPALFDPKCTEEPHIGPVGQDLALEKYDLNDEQEDALRTAITHGPLFLLQGPPGTGKTKFISAFIHCVLTNGLAKNILLVSQSHEAINHALTKTSELADKYNDCLSMVRVGQANMLSVEVRHLHDAAIQQQYREKFSAEIKVRILNAARGLGLPEPYIAEAIGLFLNLGQLVEKLSSIDCRLQATSQKIPTVQDTDADDEDNVRHRDTAREAQIEPEVELIVQKASLHATFTSIVSATYPLVALADDFRETFQRLKEHIAEKHGVQSSDRQERLEQLVKLSNELRQVLGNPKSNFTAFLARTRQVVAGTCVGIGRHAYGIVDHPYDWVIIDEAARSAATELAVAMQTGRRVLLVGDHRQLPPTYMPDFLRSLAEKLSVQQSEISTLNDFARAFESSYGRSCSRTLVSQYRMAEPICQLVSNSFYGQKLKTKRSEPGPEYGYLPNWLSSAIAWIDTADQGAKAHEHKSAGTTSLTNEAEADAILRALRDIGESDGFLKAINRSDRSGAAIGVICMYAAQRDLIRHRFNQADWAGPIREHVRIGTVDSYQGKENRIIILSLVRNNSRGEMGFLVRPERINVAMSRAMDRLVIVGTSAMWKSRPTCPMARVLIEFVKLRSEGVAQLIPSLQIRR